MVRAKVETWPSEAVQSRVSYEQTPQECVSFRLNLPCGLDLKRKQVRQEGARGQCPRDLLTSRKLVPVLFISPPPILWMECAKCIQCARPVQDGEVDEEASSPVMI